MSRARRKLVHFWPIYFMFEHSLPYPSPWCPSSQRYDVHQFPPRCLDCPKITLNPMRLSSISASVHPKVAKFSPGLPHNQSCGCWRVGNQTVDVQLNASWVVSGLTFHADRTRWLKRFTVAASQDGITFLDWGAYSHSNFTVSSAVLFRYPIRATVFRLTITEYVNHMVNVSTGFPLRINALVSNTEPFGCECTSLPTGECCPLANMKVNNGTCVPCMDPSDIHTVMVDGCGRCKPGTVPFGSSRRCVVPSRSSVARRSLEVLNLESNRDSWSVRVDLDSNVPVIVFISPVELPQCSMGLCLDKFSANKNFIPVLWDVDLNQFEKGLKVPTNRSMNQQYLQFDRGRLVLVMSEQVIRSWASCSGFQCVGFLGSLFIDQFSVVDVVHRRLVFDLASPLTNPFVCIFSRRLIPTTVELFHLFDINQYQLLFTSPELQNTPASVQWDNNPVRTEVSANGFMSLPPPTAWSSMRIFARDQQYYVAQPVPVVKLKAPLLKLQVANESTSVTMAYGLALASSPTPGDSEQLVTISAVSKQPLRLTKLTSVAGGLSTVYTTSKGFISDPKRALDLVVACNGMMEADLMVKWLENAIGLIESKTESFVQRACSRVLSGEVSKLYWLVPEIPTNAKRNDTVKVSVEAIFLW